MSGAESRETAPDSAGYIAAALATAAIGALLYNVLPLYLGTLADAKGLSLEQLGIVGSAFFLGFNVSGFSAFLWIRKVAWRKVAAGSLPFVLLSYAATAYSASYAAVTMATIATGMAVGIFYSIGTTAIADTSNPDRWYGAKVAVESIAGIVLLVALPLTLVPRYGFNGTAIGMAAMTLVLATLIAFLPARPKRSADGMLTSSSQTVGRHHGFAGAVGGVLSLLAFFAGNAAIWTFVERMGTLSAFGIEHIGNVLAAATACGVLGSLVVAAIGGRIATTPAFLSCCAAVALSLLILGGGTSFAAYATGTCLFMTGWAAGVPLAFAEIARLDHDGRYVSLAVPALGIGSMVGPAVAGWLFTHASPTGALVFSAAATGLSGALMFTSARLPSGARRKSAAGTRDTGPG